MYQKFLDILSIFHFHFYFSGSENASVELTNQIFFPCVSEPSVLVQITSFNTMHQGRQGIGTSVLDDHSPAVIGSQNEFLH